MNLLNEAKTAFNAAKLVREFDKKEGKKAFAGALLIALDAAEKFAAANDWPQFYEALHLAKQSLRFCKKQGDVQIRYRQATRTDGAGLSKGVRYLEMAEDEERWAKKYRIWGELKESDRAFRRALVNAVDAARSFWQVGARPFTLDAVLFAERIVAVCPNCAIDTQLECLRLIKQECNAPTGN